MNEKETPLSQLGLYGLIERIGSQYKNKNSSTVIGIGDDAALFTNSEAVLSGASLMLEGIHFDLTYSPLQHLGYKAVVVAISDILAMNGKPGQVIASLGLSNKMSLERVELLMSGVVAACEAYGVELAGFRPSASLTGLTISISANGSIKQEDAILRSTARPTDVLCVTGDLGGALLGLHLLEREKRVLNASGDQKPEFGNNDYVLKRQLKPEARADLNEKLKTLGIKPTAMTCIKDGLATSLLLMCKASATGCRIYENKIPLNQSTLKAASELNFNPLVAALNGGEDFEMLFSVSLTDFERIKETLPDDIHVIGYVTEAEKACRLITGADQEIDIKAQGWGSMS